MTATFDCVIKLFKYNNNYLLNWKTNCHWRNW